MRLGGKSRGFLVALSLIIIVLLLNGIYNGFIISLASTRYVNRNIVQETVEPDSQVSVVLNVGILPGDNFYLIDEIIPGGWTIIDSGGLDTSEAGHLKIAVIENAADTSYTYILRAPSSEGVYGFTGGTFRVEGMASLQPIGGESSVTVEIQPKPETCNGVDDDLDTIVDNGCDDDNDDYCDYAITRAAPYSCTGTAQCCPLGGGDCDDDPATGYYINPGSNVYCDCNAGTGGGSTRGKTEVCGNGIDEDCSGNDLPCCTITRAMWNESQAEEGKTVRLSVNGTDCANGEVILLELWESDGGSSEIVNGINLGQMAFMNNQASKQWATVWTRDTGDPTRDPEYSFKAILQSRPSVSYSSDTMRVTTNDEDKDGVHDENDCNDENPNIGECTGCAVCSDPDGYTGTCAGGTCPATACQVMCGYDKGAAACNSDEIPQFASPTEPSVCEITGNNGQCTLDCVNYNCIYNANCDLDYDNDGVPDVDDKCPNTSAAEAGIVNKHGCPKPKAAKFTSNLTTNFQEADLLGITNMTLGITGLDRIKFLGNTTIMEYLPADNRYTRVDLDSNVFMEIARVSVYGNVLTMLNKLSIVTNYNLEIPVPIIWKGNEICQDCIIIDPKGYFGGPGNPDDLSFSVSGFTEYRVNDSECGDGYCYSGPPEYEDCQTCPEDCGSCPSETPGGGTGGSGSGPSCGTRPIQPCPTAVWMGHPDCKWDTSQCTNATINCSLGAMRCLGNYLQECLEGNSTLSWHTLELCEHGCNTSSLSCKPEPMACQENWECAPWSNCTDNQQTRLCFDRNECGTFSDKPLETATCRILPPENYTSQSSCELARYYWYDEACHPEPKIVVEMDYYSVIITAAAIVIVLLLVAFAMKLMKKEAQLPPPVPV